MNYQLPAGRSQLELGLQFKRDYNIAGADHMTAVRSATAEDRLKPMTLV